MKFIRIGPAAINCDYVTNADYDRTTNTTTIFVLSVDEDKQRWKLKGDHVSEILSFVMNDRSFVLSLSESDGDCD